jgi:hypothetical protein
MANNKEVPQVIRRYVESAAAVFKANGIEFEIHMPDGMVLGGLPVVEEKKERRKRNLKRPQGVMRDYLMQFLKDLEVGGIVVVPCLPGASIGEMHSAVTSRAGALWGNKSYVSSRNVTDASIQILRVQ